MEKTKDIWSIGLPRDIKGFAAHAMTYFEGQYVLFYGERKFVYGSKCSIATSPSLLDWKKQKIVINPFIFDPACIEAGAVMPRNGKISYLYRKKAIFRDSIRMVTTSDFVKFKKHPMPVLTCKLLPKKARGLGAPRIVRNGEFYYMTIATRISKGGAVLVYRSVNLTDWSYRGMLSCQPNSDLDRTDYPALIQIDGMHILLEQRGRKSHKVLGYRLGLARLDYGSFTPFSDFKNLDYISSPRIATLPDSRMLILGGLQDINGGRDRLALPKEVSLKNGKIHLQPIKEFYERRKNENAFSFTARQAITSIKGVSGRTIELNVFADLSSATKFRIAAFMAGCRGLFISFCKDKGIAEFDFSTLLRKNKNKQAIIAVPLPKSDTLDVQLILLSDSFECFINGGEATVSRGLDASLSGYGIGFDALGTVPCEIVAYNIE